MTIRTLDRFAGMRGATERVIFRAAVALTDVDTTTGYTMLEGRAAPYGVWTNRAWYLEQFAAGLFDKSIKEAAAALPLLLWHDGMFWPIGSSTNWDSRNDGLWGQWRLDQGAEAQRAAQLAKDGHLAYLSVGYQPNRSAWTMAENDTWDPADAETLDKVIREEARLVETSLVSTPAFANAEVTLVRSGEHTNRARRTVARPYADQTREWLSNIRN